MALTQGAVGEIKASVQAAKKLLMDEFKNQLQQFYGIRSNGTCLLVEELPSRDASVIETARLLRQRLKYLEEGIAEKDKASEAVRQLVREQAFTILNRFAAMRMAEERNIIRESIRNGYNSEGFQVYDQLTGGARTADQFLRYTWYIKAVFDELAIDLPAVFDRFSPYALLFPSEKVVLELLEIINKEELSLFREPGQQPINLWTEDETIGWVYQYYNSREEIKGMRDASDSPRNSRELAVRNQFFTPRYVVQFLVDNSLGRQWYEMTKGVTSITKVCEYMVKRNQEIFMDKGEEFPENNIEDTHYVEYRKLKDPRAIPMLDPACGSMHFGLYCFDLFEQIYIEAWDNHPNLMLDLREQYLREDFIKMIPGYILRYNIHGVDIDPRAIQIAGLSLWLRAQKTYANLNLQPAERPAISKSNLVVAEPLPGNETILKDFTSKLPGPIGKLVSVIWDKMKLAGETGLLLKIEEELKQEIEIAKNEWETYKNSSAQVALFDTPEDSRAAEMAAIYGKGQKITHDFFDKAELQVLKALEDFAENAKGEDAFQKLLFAEDTTRGFAFIELCRKKYDVIVMNPPFGAGSIASEGYYKDNYSTWAKNILCCFFTRMNQLKSRTGNLASIFDRTAIIKSSYEDFRKDEILSKVKFLLDTGWGVLDANVETSCLILSSSSIENHGVFIDIRTEEIKWDVLKQKVNNSDFLEMDSADFYELPNSVVGYDFDAFQLRMFKEWKSLGQQSYNGRQGHVFNSMAHYRNYWEITEVANYRHLYNGSLHSTGYIPYRELVFYKYDGLFLKSDPKLRSSNGDSQLKKGLGYGKRGSIWDTHILKENFVFTVEGQAIPDLTELESVKLLSYTNSSLAQYVLNSFCAQHKHAGYVSLLPFSQREVVTKDIEDVAWLKKKWISYDETALEFSCSWLKKLLSLNPISVEERIKEIIDEYHDDYNALLIHIKNNDSFWLNQIKLTASEKAKIDLFSQSRPTEPLLFINDVKGGTITSQTIVSEILQNLVGIIFQRWEIMKMELPKATGNVEDLFQKLPYMPIPATPDEEVSHGDNSLVSEEFIDSDLLIKKLEIKERFGLNDFSNILSDLLFLGDINDLEKYFKTPNGFFDYHYNRYTQSRRESPIYWPLSTPSNSLVIWLYYPRLNNSSLFSIINKIVDPKINATKEMIYSLKDGGGSSKDLNKAQAFFDELKLFKDELLSVANLSLEYEQDDGVLINAAPFHNLFQHSKWRKSTKATWKKLEKGDYDWAHLAYSVWPERVRKKAKKNLSLAIAHGLEEICEIKLKETKKKKRPEVKKENQMKIN